MRSPPASLLAAVLQLTACSRSIQLSSGSAGGAGSGSTAATPTLSGTTAGVTSSATTNGATTTGSTTSTSSSAGGAIYTAFNLATNLPRYVIFKAEPAANRCVELMVSMSGGPGIGIKTVNGWTVDQALVTAHASDCALDANGYPIVTMMSTTAQSGSGTLDQQPAGFQPCLASVHATLTFPAGSPWAPPVDMLDADNLAVQGGGCGG